MLRSFSSSVKNVFSAFSNVLFPPLCIICKERCQTKIFCPSCWSLCNPPDPLERCPHCFSESEGLCRACIKKPHLSFTQACIFDETDSAYYLAREDAETVAAFAIRAWVNLDWQVPDLVIPMPGCKEIALYFAEMISRPLGTDFEAIEENQVLLVINVNSTIEELERVLKELALASPKRGFILSMFMPKNIVL